LLHGRSCIRRFSSGPVVKKSPQIKQEFNPYTSSEDDRSSVTSQMTVPIMTSLRKSLKGNNNATENVVIGYKVDPLDNEHEAVALKVPNPTASNSNYFSSGKIRSPDKLSMLDKALQSSKGSPTEYSRARHLRSTGGNDLSVNTKCDQDYEVRKHKSEIKSKVEDIAKDLVCTVQPASTQPIRTDSDKDSDYEETSSDDDQEKLVVRKGNYTGLEDESRKCKSEVKSKVETIANDLLCKKSEDPLESQKPDNEEDFSDNEDNELHIVEELTWNEDDESSDEKPSPIKVAKDPVERSSSSEVHETLLPPPTKRSREMQGLRDEKGNFPVVLNSVRKRNSPREDKVVTPEPDPPRRRRRRNEFGVLVYKNQDYNDYHPPSHAVSHSRSSEKVAQKRLISSSTTVNNSSNKKRSLKSLSKASNPLRNFKMAIMAEEQRRKTSLMRKPTNLRNEIARRSMAEKVRRDLELSEDESEPHIEFQTRFESSNAPTSTVVKMEEVMLDANDEDSFNNNADDSEESFPSRSLLDNLLERDNNNTEIQNEGNSNSFENLFSRINEEDLEDTVDPLATPDEGDNSPDEQPEIRISNVCSVVNVDKNESEPTPTSSTSTKDKIPFKCDVCSKGFVSNVHLKVHKSVCHGNRAVSNVTCDICGKKFITKYQFEIHYRAHAKDNEKRQNQNTNNHNNEVVEIVQPQHLNNTQSRSSDNNAPKNGVRRPSCRYFCSHCKKWFLDMNLFHLHRSMYHINVKGERFRANECEICLTEFHDVLTLQQHVDEIRHKPEDGKRYQCSVCRKCFAQKKNMRTHNRMHVGQKPFTCDLCPASFFCSKGLKSHREKHKSNQLTYKCSACGQGFVLFHMYEAHIRSHISEPKENDYGETATSSHVRPSSMKEFSTCGTCFLYFYAQVEFEAHQRLHHSNQSDAVEQVLLCSMCSDTFPSSLHVEVHMLDHEAKNSIPCSLCKRLFKVQAYLDKHLERAHGISQNIPEDYEGMDGDGPGFLPPGMVEAVLGDGNEVPPPTEVVTLDDQSNSSGSGSLLMRMMSNLNNGGESQRASQEDSNEGNLDIDPLAEDQPSQQEDDQEEAVFSIIQVVSQQGEGNSKDSQGIRESSINRGQGTSDSLTFRDTNGETVNIVRRPLPKKRVVARKLTTFPVNAVRQKNVERAIPVVTLEESAPSPIPVAASVVAGIKCSICQVGFSSQASLDVHVQEDHYKFFKCSFPDCGGLFTSAEARTNHEKIHGLILKNCDLCGYEPTSAEQLTLHMKIHIRDDETKPHYCELCPSFFESLPNLNAHNYQMHTIKQCKLCGHCFASSSALNAHVLTCIQNTIPKAVNVRIVERGRST